MIPSGSPQWTDLLGPYVVLAVLGLLAASLIVWVIAGEVGEQRSARAAARFAHSRGAERKPSRYQP